MKAALWRGVRWLAFWLLMAMVAAVTVLEVRDWWTLDRGNIEPPQSHDRGEE